MGIGVLIHFPSLRHVAGASIFDTRWGIKAQAKKLFHCYIIEILKAILDKYSATSPSPPLIGKL